MFDIEKIVQAQSMADALRLLSATPGSLVVAGGTDVLLQVRDGRLAGCSLVSINGLPELKGTTQDKSGTILIRALTTFSEISESELIQAQIPTLCMAAEQVGGLQLRNVGTIGGNICNGATSADMASTLLTLNARLELVGPNGSRTTDLEGFYEGPGKVAKAPDEILVGIRIVSQDYKGFCGHYIKHAQRRAMDIASLGCAVNIRVNPDKKTIDELRLAFGVAAPTPVRCHKAEELARGAVIGDELIEAIANAALGDTMPRTSWRASKEFRIQLIYELSKRALRAALQKAGAAQALNGDGN
jgi:xanthine dehydrogenase FAD-binding subunit